MIRVRVNQQIIEKLLIDNVGTLMFEYESLIFYRVARIEHKDFFKTSKEKKILLQKYGWRLLKNLKEEVNHYRLLPELTGWCNNKKFKRYEFIMTFTEKKPYELTII